MNTFEGWPVGCSYITYSWACQDGNTIHRHSPLGSDIWSSQWFITEARTVLSTWTWVQLTTKKFQSEWHPSCLVRPEWNAIPAGSLNGFLLYAGKLIWPCGYWECGSMKMTAARKGSAWCDVGCVTFAGRMATMVTFNSFRRYLDVAEGSSRPYRFYVVHTILTTFPVTCMSYSNHLGSELPTRCQPRWVSTWRALNQYGHGGTSAWPR